MLSAITTYNVCISLCVDNMAEEWHRCFTAEFNGDASADALPLLSIHDVVWPAVGVYLAFCALKGGSQLISGHCLEAVYRQCCCVDIRCYYYSES